MRSFFKFFFASLFALVVFFIIGIVILIGWVSSVASSSKAETGNKAVLFLDLSQEFRERMQENPLSGISSDDQYDLPGLYDVVRLIRHAKGDSSVKGIYIKCNGNSNGFASSEEIRNAIIDFKKSGKFVFAYGDVISQKAYYVANVADKIYCNPKGGVDWRGYATEIPFLKQTLQKLEIDPQIFYAGKFKSATEPLREDKMTDANRLQTSELLNELFNSLLYSTAESRGLDSALLRKCVNEHLIRFAKDALYYKLVDGLRYDDQVKDEIREKLSIERSEKLNFVPIAKYARAVEFRETGKDRIALIYAEGDIVGGKGDQQEIGGDTYRWLIRQARMDKDIKAVVIRINSGGGSSLVSENLWREISVTRKEKPVVISFGDVAASGAYYLSCHADSIFAEPTTITGSIGVFSIIPNLQQFFKNKLGISFDGVKTAPDADELSVTKPLTPLQKQFMQNEVDSIYHDFKSRVAKGRNISIEYVDSIGQGRVWTGQMGLKLGLVDRLGNIQDAIDCAARLAKTNDYRLKEYPEPKGLLDLVLGNYKKTVGINLLREEMGEDAFKSYTTLKKIKQMSGTTQTRMMFDIDVE